MDREDSIRRQLRRFGLQEAQEGPGIRLGPGSRHRGIRRHPASAAIFWATPEEGSGVRPKYVGRGGLPKGMGWKAPRPESPRRRNKPLRHPLASELRACGEDS
jgi:hypothetical protein